MPINLNFPYEVSVYETVLGVLRGIHSGEIAADDPDVLRIIEIGDLDQQRLGALESVLEDMHDGIVNATERFNDKLGVLEAAYTPKSS